MSDVFAAPKNVKAILYTRWSPRKNADDCESSVTQLARLRPYCQSQGWEIIAELDDADRSGASTEGREALEEALQLACKHKGVIVVYALSRIARSTRDAIAIADRLDKAGANLCSISENLDTTFPVGRFVFRLLASLAELEREQTAQRTSDAMRRRQADGQPMSSKAPYGQRIVKIGGVKRLVPDEHKQQALARLAELAALGWGSARIQQALKKEKFKISRATVARRLQAARSTSSTRN